MFPSAPSSSRMLLDSLRVSVRLGTQTYRLGLTSGASTLQAPPSISASPSAHNESSLTLRPALAGIAAPAAESPSSSPWSDLGAALWDGLLRAVPKKKVSHSRKSMRAANKGLKDRTDLVHCSACGKPKLHHHICASCFFEISRQQKSAQRQQS
ncbi:hypothetical protein BCV70DRAFT_201827 [Testicularia cyperi]|uniref:Large ribosomal subunit protein bL32m n=1 Tax=Testicularia cyperi TaxID=1882483 RepID=A0A317XKW2_9BASI|nr:hypothetical protein BCV70DRAFT_201827 [Testicularia cyperi]